MLLKLLKFILIAGAVIVVAIAVLLGFAIYFSKPPPPQADRLAALPEAERATLEAVLKATDLKLSDFRDVGAGATLDDARNYKSIAIERGHVRTFSFQNAKLSTLPSLSAWTELESASLRDSGLTALPDLSGCTGLKKLDASRNQIAAITPGVLPASLEWLDLSENPITDLAPLATLIKAEEIRVQKANVSNFEALIDLPLPLLDLRHNPIEKLPERFPKSRDFRVDLEGCPVFTPPGYLRDWKFTIRQSGVPGGRSTQEGAVSAGTFESKGTWDVVPNLTTVSLLTSKAAAESSMGAVDVEVKVKEGRLRVYLGEDGQTRGPWFQRGFVKGTDAFFQTMATVYADAEPGKPAHLHGHASHFNGQDYYFYVEPLEGPPVKGMSYRVWRD